MRDALTMPLPPGRRRESRSGRDPSRSDGRGRGRFGFAAMTAMGEKKIYSETARTMRIVE
jgi:hypothetical protein